MRLHIYTDGSCLKNPGVGGWSFVVVDASTASVVLTRSGSEQKTTNNRMELIAVIEALGHISPEEDIKVYSDSQYVIYGITDWINSWKTKDFRKVKNADLWRMLDRAVQDHSGTISWQWVRGHNGNEFNELADSLARVAAADLKGA